MGTDLLIADFAHTMPLDQVTVNYVLISCVCRPTCVLDLEVEKVYPLHTSSEVCGNILLSFNASC